MDPLQLRVYIWMYFSNLVREQNATISDLSYTFDDNVLGTLDLTNLLITGFETFKNDIQNINVSDEDEDGNNDLCVVLPAGNLQFNMNYEADIGIDNEIPIYGEGDFSVGIEDVEFKACMFVNFNQTYIDNVVFQGIYRHNPLQFTGFWRNNEVSLILENFLNIANRFVAMWNAYEPERAACLWSPFVSYVLNVWFGNEDSTIEFDSDCLKEMFFDKEEIDEITDVSEHILRKIMKSHDNDDANDDTLNKLAEEDKSIILPIIKHLSQFILRIL